MKRMLSVAVVGVLAMAYSQATAADDFKSSKQALQALNDFVGSWTGDAKTGPTKVKKETWAETIEWGWKFKGDDAWMVLKFKDAKIFKTGEAKYLLDKKIYQFAMIDAQDKKVVFTGNMDKDYLVLERVDETTKDTYRVKMNMAAEGVRMLYTYDRKAEGKTLYSNEFQVASSRAGESLGPKARQERECVVSGGLGNGQVTFKGVSYWICCSGCRDAFNEMPEKYVREFEAKKKK